MRKGRPPNVMIINCRTDNIRCTLVLVPRLQLQPVLLASRRLFGRSTNKYTSWYANSNCCFEVVATADEQDVSYSANALSVL